MNPEEHEKICRFSTCAEVRNAYLIVMLITNRLNMKATLMLLETVGTSTFTVRINVNIIGHNLK